MNRQTISKIITGLLVATGVAVAPVAAAWPDRPISIVVPYAPGGTADALARIVAERLGPQLDTSAVVINRAGASGVIGSSSVARSRPDGYTVLYDATPLSINPHLQTLPFNPSNDLAPVTLVAVTPMIVTVPADSPYSTFDDLINAAKQSPGELTYGSGGQGTVQFMAATLMHQAIGADLLHVPFRSGGEAINALIGKHIDMMFVNLPAVSGHINGGLARPLAITSSERNTAYPDVPTVGESAIEGYEAYEWNGMFVPSGTPDDIVEKLNEALRNVLAMPDVQAQFERLGSRIVASTPAEFGSFFESETAKWATTVEAAGIEKE